MNKKLFTYVHCNQTQKPNIKLNPITFLHLEDLKNIYSLRILVRVPKLTMHSQLAFRPVFLKNSAIICFFPAGILVEFWWYLAGLLTAIDTNSYISSNKSEVFNLISINFNIKIPKISEIFDWITCVLNRHHYHHCPLQSTSSR